MTRDEFNPIRDAAVELPVPEVGDHASFEREPEPAGPGDPADTPELERLDLEADEPGPDDDNPLGGVI